MYSKCLFCHSSFGTNDLLEHFDMGRRIAFDPGRGRLWIVCLHCQQWNLSPIDQRWEAIEECEKLYRTTPLRISTDQVSLTRLRTGLELVRIGDPLPTEMAVWRYGDQFGRRRRRRLLLAGLGTAGVGISVIGGVALGMGITGIAYLGTYWQVALRPDPDTIVTRVPLESGESANVRRADLRYLRLLPARRGNPWRFEISESETLQGAFAINAAGLVLPHLNRFGGTRRCVEDAVSYLGRHRGADSAFASVASGAAQLAALPRAIRLALEMAAHEEVEQDELLLEMALLERSWREAEEVAAIADGLTVPPEIERLLAKLKESIHPAVQKERSSVGRVEH